MTGRYLLEKSIHKMEGHISIFFGNSQIKKREARGAPPPLLIGLKPPVSPFNLAVAEKNAYMPLHFIYWLFKQIPPGHFGISFAFISLSDPELWALKVKWWSNFISMKFFVVRNCRIFGFFLIAPVARLDIFFYFFLYRLTECVPKYIE